MKFNFKAKTRQGEIKEGVIDAATSDAAVEVLQKNNLFPISLKEEKSDKSLGKSFMKYMDRVTAKELVVFFRQLAILIEAKVPIVSSLKAIKDQTGNPYFQGVIEGMVNDIQDGLPLSDALKKYNDVFSTLSINVIRAGEVSGNLRKSVGYIADNIERNYNLASKVRSAMLYPAVVLIVFFIIAFLVMAFIIPKITVMIKEMNTEVPWYTAVVVGVSDFMASYWWAILVAIIGFVGGILYYIRTEDGKKEWDQIKIKLPVFGKVYENVYITRMTENLSVLLAGGIPVIRALQVVSSVINNSVYEEVILRAAEEVNVGGEMSDVFKKYPVIPPVVSQMVRIGEESGQVDVVLKQVAEFYEEETDRLTKNLSTLIEPILMVIIGVAVGFLAFSVIMPIYNIAGQL